MPTLPRQRLLIRRLIQRILFPRLWKALMRLGFEPDDATHIENIMTQKDEEEEEDDVDDGSDGGNHNDSDCDRDTDDGEDMDGEANHDDHACSDHDVDGIALASVESSVASIPTSTIHGSSSANCWCDMSFVEQHLDRKLRWLRSVEPSELGIPPRFLRPQHHQQQQHQTPTHTRILSYRTVIDSLEEMGQLTSPADMLACLLLASKQIYTVAQEYIQTHAAVDDATSTSSKVEALGADSFFPIFLYVLIHASVPNWFHRLKLMQRFGAGTGNAGGSDTHDDESASEQFYYCTTLEAALIFILKANTRNINPNQQQTRTTKQSGSSKQTKKPTVPQSTSATVVVPSMSGESKQESGESSPLSHSLPHSDTVTTSSADSSTSTSIASGSSAPSSAVTPASPSPPSNLATLLHANRSALVQLPAPESESAPEPEHGREPAFVSSTHHTAATDTDTAIGAEPTSPHVDDEVDHCRATADDDASTLASTSGLAEVEDGDAQPTDDDETEAQPAHAHPLFKQETLNEPTDPDLAYSYSYSTRRIDANDL